MDDSNCVSGHEATGAEGFEEVQGILGDLVSADETYSVLFGDETEHFTSYFDAPSRTAGILRNEIGRRWYTGGNRFQCMLGGSARPFYTLPGLIGHELLGHGSGQATAAGAIGVENLVHRARGEVPRCR